MLSKSRTRDDGILEKKAICREPEKVGGMTIFYPAPESLRGCAQGLLNTMARSSNPVI